MVTNQFEGNKTSCSAKVRKKNEGESCKGENDGIPKMVANRKRGYFVQPCHILKKKMIDIKNYRNTYFFD